MTAPINKTVRVLGPTGATGVIERVHILPSFTGPTGTFPIWLQAATGATGFKNVVDATGMTGPNGEIKTVIISGYVGPR
jgi:hypothetical protein